MSDTDTSQIVETGIREKATCKKRLGSAGFDRLCHHQKQRAANKWCWHGQANIDLGVALGEIRELNDELETSRSDAHRFGQSLEFSRREERKVSAILRAVRKDFGALQKSKHKQTEEFSRAMAKANATIDELRARLPLSLGGHKPDEETAVNAVISENYRLGKWLEGKRKEIAALKKTAREIDEQKAGEIETLKKENDCLYAKLNSMEHVGSTTARDRRPGWGS